MKAFEVLEKASSHMKDREQTYDTPGGERSIPKTVAMFNALTGHELTDEQGWLFMCCLKMVRTQQGDFRADNYEDLAAYAALCCETASVAAQAKKAKLSFGDAKEVAGKMRERYIKNGIVMDNSHYRYVNVSPCDEKCCDTDKGIDGCTYQNKAPSCEKHPSQSHFVLVEGKILCADCYGEHLATIVTVAE